MGCCLGSALCCAGSLCCSMLCMPCKAAGVHAKNYSKIGYTFFQVIWMAVALLLFFLSDELVHVEWLKTLTRGSLDHLQQSDELAIQFVARMSFILLLFHSLIFLITLARNEMAAQVHDGCWGAKALLVAAGYIASWWMPASFFDKFYLPVAQVLSAVFLLYQVLLMLAAAYKVNERLVRNMENDPSKCSAAILVAVTLCVFAGALAWMITSFAKFTCAKAIVWQCITLVCVLLMFVLQFCGARADASILTNGLAAVYCFYLQWSALSADPNPACNPNAHRGTNAALQICLGVLITAFALFMMSGTAPTGDDPTKVDKEEVVVEEALPPGTAAGETAAAGADKRAALIQTHEHADEDSGDEMERKHHVFAISSQTIFFQLTMMLSSMYYAMLCTNWLEPGLYTDGTYGSATTYWLKMVCLWLSSLVYLYSMVAPLLFPNRSFQ